MKAVLKVRFHGELAGLLEQEWGRLRFAYDEQWLARARPALSHSLPLRADPFDDAACRPFFAGLLPEGEVRDLIARRFGITTRNDFALLDAIGGDCAGDVSLLPIDRPTSAAKPGAIRWLDDQGLADLIADLPERPLFADPDGGVRLSLAGVQEKLPVICRGGRIGITGGEVPSTHILKAPIARYPDTVLNEAYCLRLARAVGLYAVSAEPLRAHDQECLLVERHDRTVTGDEIRRIHQEDFCQALAISPEQKYEAEGGPTLIQCAQLIRAACASPARDLLALADAAAFNLLIGNHDAHGKNFSLLYAPDGARLAPLYDLVSTFVYPGLSRRMAMRIGGEYRPDYVERRHIELFAADAGLGPAALRARIRAIADEVEREAPKVAEQTREQAQGSPILDRIVKLVRHRARHLARVAA